MDSMKLCKILGDGIGQEVVPVAVDVLKSVFPELEVVEAQAGWQTFLDTGNSVPEVTLQAIGDCEAAIFGAVSSPSKKVEGYRSAILQMRQKLKLAANIRPVDGRFAQDPRPDICFVVVRENSEGLYSGRERSDDDMAIAERVITRQASESIGRVALEVARKNDLRRITIVHKANVLPQTDGLFRDCVRKVIESEMSANEELTIDEMLVDIAALRLVSEPEKFGVIVTTNLFGDILSDIGAYWCGGMGMAPSINFGEQVALCEPVHGSAPDIAGKGIADPRAAILSVALLCRYQWNRPDIASNIEDSVLEISNEMKLNESYSTEFIANRVQERLASFPKLAKL